MEVENAKTSNAIPDEHPGREKKVDRLRRRRTRGVANSYPFNSDALVEKFLIGILVTRCCEYGYSRH